MTRAGPLRVAMFGLRAPWGTQGGVEQAVAALAPRLADRGCAVTVYCRRRYNTLGPGVHQGVRLVNVDTIYGKHAEAFVHSALCAPRAALRADVVHVHATGPALFSWIPRAMGVATVATVHGMDWQRGKWGGGARAVLKAGAWSAATWPHEVIVVGQHLQQHVQETYGRSTHVVPNGVDPIPDVPFHEADISGVEPGRYLLSLGRLVPEKGLERLIDAWAAARDPLPLIIVGGSSHTDDYVAALRRRAPSGVHLVGPRFGRAKAAALRHAAASVSASTLEGLPLVPLEAMAAGTPVVLSDIPPHREVLGDVDGEAGWLVPDERWPEAIARASALAPPARSEMGAAGVAWVRDRYGWDAVADATLQVYEAAARQVR